MSKLHLFAFAAALSCMASASSLQAAGSRYRVHNRDAVPTLDIASSCRDISTVEVKTTSYENCIAEENTARDQLRIEWPKFSANAHEQCMHLVAAPALPSYVTLQQCLQMKRDAENLAKSPQGIGLTRP